MIQKIKNIVLSLSLLFSLTALPLTVAAPAYAAPTAAQCSTNPALNGCPQQSQINGNLCQGSNFDLSGSSKSTTANCQQGASTLQSKIKTVLNVLSAIIGIVAVIMIIYAGFRYVTSAGSEGGVKSAKNAIIYAVIGLVVVALAQVIVHFVITNATA